jgi:hypothetical protein
MHHRHSHRLLHCCATGNEPVVHSICINICIQSSAERQKEVLVSKQARSTATLTKLLLMLQRGTPVALSLMLSVSAATNY